MVEQNLTHQIQFPLTNPNEMGNDFNNIIKTLSNDNYYNKAFNKIYKDGITKENIGNALEEFQKTLVTPSAFDEYLRGDENALTSDQKRIWTFSKKRCISCHNGINIGGGLFARFGLIDNTITDILEEKEKYEGENPHLGLYNVTKNDFDKYYFKVPSLRNVALTGPYLHDGRVETLKEAISSIAKAQLGLNLTDEEVLLIEEFLKSLNGKVTIIKWNNF